MSFELDWQSLSPILAKTFTTHLNRILTSVPTPSFLDPIVIQAIDFGDTAPDIQLIDIRDISRAFSEADTCAQPRPQAPVLPIPDSPLHSTGWVPNNAHPSSPRPRTELARSFADGAGRMPDPAPTTYESNLSHTESALPDWSNDAPERQHGPTSDAPEPKTSSSSQPSLELHLKVTYSGNMRIDLSTALVLNHPSPLFMSLPIKMRVVGFVFAAELVVALEADRSRCHVTVFEPQPSPEEEAGESFDTPDLTPGARILPEMLIQTEVGNADKHVLRNVGKVERFLLETLRKIICDELLFPVRECFV